MNPVVLNRCKNLWHFFFIFAFLTILIVPGFSKSESQHIVSTAFGNITVEERVISELLDSATMKRLEHIDQSGTPRYFTSHIPSYSRYSHSVGVYALLKMKGAPLNELVAGLLHDASHTVFSHTGDWVMNLADQEQAYQDNIHAWYLEKMGTGEILSSNNIQIKEIIHKDNGHIRLEQELPDMCADRIEYNLHTALIFGLLSKAELRKIIDDLKFENGKWFFTKPQLAKKFAHFSLYFTENFWGAPFNQVINYWSGLMMKRAFEIGLCSQDEFHFGKDVDILAKLRGSNDPVIKGLLDKCQNYNDFYEVVEEGPYDIHTKPKFRGIDPLVRVKNQLVRLTQLDDEFRNEYDRVRSRINRGIKIRFL